MELNSLDKSVVVFLREEEVKAEGVDFHREVVKGRGSRRSRYGKSFMVVRVFPRFFSFPLRQVSIVHLSLHGHWAHPERVYSRRPLLELKGTKFERRRRRRVGIGYVSDFELEFEVVLVSELLLHGLVYFRGIGCTFLAGWTAGKWLAASARMAALRLRIPRSGEHVVNLGSCFLCK